MEKETLDWIFAKGPLVGLVILWIIKKITKLDKYLITKKDELGTPKTVYVGTSKPTVIIFKIHQFVVVYVLLSVFIYSCYFRGWVGN